MPRILLTGANGQLGHYIQELAPQLLDEDSVLIPCTREQLDLSDPASIHLAIETHQPDVVINAAAYTAVDQAESEPDLARRINGDAVADLVAACSKTGARLIQISTDYIFDGTKTEPYQIHDHPNPINVYGATKLLGEQHVAAYLGKGCIVRTSWVYSEFGKNFANTMRNLFTRLETLRVISDQTARPTHARDLANQCLKLALQKEPLPPVIHFAGPDILSWYDLACRLLKEAGSDVVTQNIIPIQSSEYPTAAKRPLFTVLALNY